MDDNKLKKNICDLYLKILEREPDEEGLEYFLNNIKQNIFLSFLKLKKIHKRRTFDPPETNIVF